MVWYYSKHQSIHLLELLTSKYIYYMQRTLLFNMMTAGCAHRVTFWHCFADSCCCGSGCFGGWGCSCLWCRSTNGGGLTCWTGCWTYTWSWRRRLHGLLTILNVLKIWNNKKKSKMWSLNIINEIPHSPERIKRENGMQSDARWSLPRSISPGTVKDEEWMLDVGNTEDTPSVWFWICPVLWCQTWTSYCQEVYVTHPKCTAMRCQGPCTWKDV